MPSVAIHRAKVLLLTHHAKQICKALGCRRRSLEAGGDGWKKSRHCGLGLVGRQPELTSEQGHGLAVVRALQILFRSDMFILLIGLPIIDVLLDYPRDQKATER